MYRRILLAALVVICSYTTMSLGQVKPSVQFTSSSSSGSEDVNTVVLTVSLSQAISQPVTVNYAVTGGTAESVYDYVFYDGTLTFPANVTTQNITISIYNDSIDEYDETIIITLSNVSSNAALGTFKTHTYTILDNDNPPRAYFPPGSTTIGEENIGLVQIPVWLSGASYKQVQVGYTITGGTATLGADYNMGTGTLTFQPGYTAGQYILLLIENDSYGENDETIIITLSNPVNCTIGDANTFTFTITDDGDPPTITFPETSSSGLESVTEVSIPVQRVPGPEDVTSTVNYLIMGGSATLFSDYTGGTGTLTFEPGETTQYIPLTIVNDGAQEENETIILFLTGPVNAQLGSDDYLAYMYTINNDDDTSNPYTHDLIPAANATQVARNTTIQLYIADQQVASTSGVDINSVRIELSDVVIYDGNNTEPNGTYTSSLGICSRSGTASNYKFIFRPFNLFDYEQKVNISVYAEDNIGNTLEQDYHFFTVMRSFGKNAKVNTDTGKLVQDHPATAIDASGNIFVVWDQTTINGYTDICIGWLVNGNNYFSMSEHVYNEPNVQKSNPVIAIGNSTLYVAWQSREDGGKWDIYVSKSPNGVIWSDPVLVNVGDPNNQSNQTNPSIGIDILDPHTIYIAYQDDRAGNNDVWVATSTDGTDWAETRITSNTASQTDPVVGASDPFNTGYVLWKDARNSTDSNDIYFAAESDGWTERKIVGGSTNDYSPATAAYDIAHLLWVRKNGSYSNILYANDANGIPVTGIGITDQTNITVSEPTIAVQDMESFTKVFAAWTDGRNVNKNSDTDIYFIENGSSGFLDRHNILVNDDTGTAVQSSPAINVDLNGNPYLVWVDSRNGNKDIYYAGATSVDSILPTTVQIDGNTITVQCSTDENLKVSIPLAALPSGYDANNVTIASVVNPPALPTGGFGVCYDFGPSGLIFNQAVTITIPHEASECPGLPVYNAYWYNSATGTWSQTGISNVQHHTLSSTLHTVSFETTHFTAFCVSSTAETSSDSGGGGGGGGCAMSKYPGQEDIIGFFVPYIIVLITLLLISYVDAGKRKAKSNS
jgi:hypothetical protein